MKYVKGMIMIIFISFIISFLVYLSLIPEDKKPTTYKELKLEHFIR